LREAKVAEVSNELSDERYVVAEETYHDRHQSTVLIDVGLKQIEECLSVGQDGKSGSVVRASGLSGKA
jgi:hypothetical protein